MDPSPSPASRPASDRAKSAAARRAAEMVEDGMRVGLGTGTTAAFLVDRLAERVRDEGLGITAVPTSTRTADRARRAGIEVVELDEARWLDLTIDGADEVDGSLALIKGGGGALLREKIVATASERFVAIVDASKRVETLGAFPLPVDVIPFGWQATRALIEEALLGLDVQGRTIALRMKGREPFLTDEGQYVLDLHLNRIGNPRELGVVLNQIPGVVENGLFVDVCDALVTGFEDGRTEVRDLAAEQPRSKAEAGKAKGAGPEDGDNIFTDVAG